MIISKNKSSKYSQIFELNKIDSNLRGTRVTFK